MSKKIGVVVALAGMCALSLFLLSCGSSSSRPSGLLYVLTQGNNGTGNNVSSFSIDLGSGNLSLINSNASVCCGLPLDILLDPTGAVAFVLSQGAISSYPVNSDGSLGTPTTPWTVPAGDTAMAMTRDAAGQFLFVLDTGSSPPPANCPPRGSGDPSFAGCPSISVFTMQPGSGTLAGGSPFYVSKVPTGLSAITFPTPSGTSPPCGTTTSEEFLYVTSNQDLLPPHNDNTVSMYCVDSSGNLSETANSPFATQVDPLSVLAVNTNPAGQNTGGIFVYVGSQPTASGALSIFQMDVNNTLLLPVGTEPPSTGQKPVEMLVDPTNNFLYVVCEDSNQVYGYGINTTAGTLTALNPPYEPTGSQPVALAMHSTGKFLYTSNSNASNISGFTVSTTTGSMSTPITVTSPAGPSGMAAR